MTPEQVQKFAEIGNVCEVPCGFLGGCTNALCQPADPSEGYPHPEQHVHRLPDFAHDLQACVDVLERFCGERFGWRIEKTDAIRAMIFRRGMLTGNEKVPGFAKADKITEAIIAAVIAAAEQKETQS